MPLTSLCFILNNFVNPQLPIFYYNLNTRMNQIGLHAKLTCQPGGYSKYCRITGNYEQRCPSSQ
jgi:hypothetical protein